MKSKKEIQENIKHLQDILKNYKKLGWSSPRIRLTGKVFSNEKDSDDFLATNTQLKLSGEADLYFTIKILNWVLDKKHYSL